MSFLTEVRQSQHPIVMAEIIRQLDLKDKVLSAVPAAPSGSKGRAVLVAGFWLDVGSLTPTNPDHYVITESVRRNLRNLARVVSAR